MGERKVLYRVLVEKPLRKSPLGIPGSKWEEFSFISSLVF